MLTDQQEEAILLGLLASSCLAMHEEHKTSMKQRRRQRRWWVRPSLQEREKLGHANQLLPLLRDRDVEYYREIAYKVRDLLAKHFITIGKVPWQERKIMDKSLCSGE
ncbi:hypothetical protein HPB50_028369 [Hyalomma asiaticum]|nr:hypothetical protein HPB50_028369 [Hyalomma asiaticum]